MYYSKLKIFRHPEKLRSLERGLVTSPIHVRVKPTNRCNHNCAYCSYQNSYGQLGKDMSRQDEIPIEKMREIINDCAAMKVKAITFSGGGEPLLYKGLREILHQANNNDISTSILTNGVFLTGNLRAAALHCCSWIRISMDGWDRDSYAAYRSCNPDDFDKLIANLKELAQDKGKCVIGVNIIVDDENAAHLYELVSMVHDLGIKSIKISPCIVSNDAKKNNDLHFAIRPIVLQQLEKIVDAGIGVYNSYHAQLDGFKKEYSWCPYIQILPIIGADQNVYACHDKAYNKDTGMLGSIKDRSFREFWFDGDEKFMKINPSKHCSHHCITHNTNKMLFEYFDTYHREFV